MTNELPRELRHKIHHVAAVVNEVDDEVLHGRYSRDEIKDNIDLQFINSGRHRHTFKLGDDYVIKVGSRQANKREIDAWESVPEDVKKYFCPIHDYSDDYSWLVMSRADDIRNFSEMSKDERWDIEYDLKDRMEEMDVVISDVITKNIGALDDRHVIIDYAEFDRIDR